METLREVLHEARQNEVAVGHFNISDLAGLKAVFESARALGVPVIVGLSEGERSFMGVREAAAAVKVLRHEYDYPIFLNADHTHSLASAEDAARAGSIRSCLTVRSYHSIRIFRKRIEPSKL